MSAPPLAPRRLRRSVRVIGLVAGTCVAALAVGRTEHLAGWWSIFLTLGALVAFFSAHASQRLRLVTLLFGVVPYLGLAVGWQAGADPYGLWDLAAIPVASVLAWVMGEMLDALRVRFAPGPRAFSIALGAAAMGVLAIVTLVAADAYGPEPDRAALLVDRAIVDVPAIPLLADGITELPGPDLDCETTADGARACILERTGAHAERQRLPQVVEGVRADGRRFLRPRGSRDVATWLAVDEHAVELRRVDASVLPRPPRVARSLPLSLGLGGLVVIALGVLQARDRRLRAAVLGGIDAISDGEVVEVNGQRVPIAAPAGPVVLLGTRSKGGAYRLPPSIDASAFVSGTRHGRALRLAARITRLPAIAALVLALTVIPMLVALLSGATFRGAP